jgi:hypothetical protein
MPIVLNGDASAVDLSDPATPLHPQREQRRHRGLDGRMPLSLSVLEQSGHVESDNGSGRDIRKRKRGPDDDEPQDEVVWLYGRLLSYKVVNGKPLVLVPWYPTWEPPDEYSREEVERVKRQYTSQIPRKRQGRPPLRKIGGISDGSLHISTTNTPDSRMS